MNNINASIFEKNLRFISPKKPQLAVDLMTATIPDYVRVFQTQNKQFTAEVKNSPDCIKLLHSAVDPWEEAKCWARVQNINTEAFALLGLGMCYPALALIEQGFRCRIYLVEKDIGIFKLAATYRDLTKIFTADNVDLFIGTDADNFPDFLRTNNTASLSYKIYQPAASLYSQFYNDLSYNIDKIMFEINRSNDPQCFAETEALLKAMSE